MSDILRDSLSENDYQKLMGIPNPKLHAFLADAIELCNPDSVFVCTDAPEDIAYIRKRTVEAGEEQSLAIEGHTVHFDGIKDLARDKGNTKYLVPPGIELGRHLNSIPKEEGLAEVRGYLDNSMAGREAFIRFFCLGPVNSLFSIRGVQITDSVYVAHSEDLLYRLGYEEFKREAESDDFFRVLHSAGELENAVSVNSEKRRVYIDIEDDIVYSANTQYGGNTIGFKKLALRLAIRKADREGWLAEHMSVMGVHGPKGRVTYFAGAFPSACGKTSTSMLPGETIIGDDIAYLRNIDGQVMGVNVEYGIFGIIQDVSLKDDPVIYEVLTAPGEVIFSNVLVKDGRPYWLGMGCDLPAEGVNYSGQWYPGKTDDQGNELLPSHKNARYTISLRTLANLDPRADDPKGVPIQAIVYGGRDSDTWVPVQQSLDWAHGVITMGASLESETTAAALGKEGVRTHQPMSNLDFVSIPLGQYVQNHLDFVADMEKPALIFGVNYFLKNENGKYLNSMMDKAVWIKWAELRVHADVDAIKTATGFIPLCGDLKRLFREVLDRDYTEAQYNEQFKTRIPLALAKLDRIEQIYCNDVPDTPAAFFACLAEQRARLCEAREQYGDYVFPSQFQA